MLSSHEIRRQFIDFFVERCGHTHVASAPVVPHDDPTLLFTNAGMNQFKDVFLGLGERNYTRAVNSQKCIRAGGKHNDLDDVGKDTYHHTFFEMLGNWSFGDYFKREAIQYAWQLLTEVWQLEPDRLHATVFAGDESLGLEPDEEAERLWKEVTGIPHDHISRAGTEDNFWEMGDTGPCGPCSEIHIDLTPDKSGAELVNQGDPRVVELWNLVFIQFNRDTEGTLTPLPAQHIDTGMGFERLVAVLQNKASNYDTDVFTPLFEAIQKITGASDYSGQLESPVDVAYRVIADHARCLTFALTDGAVPSNEGRGYVLRRILRRGVRYGRQNLGMTEPFLHRLVPVVVDQMADAFPELKDNPDHVAEVIREEEESFGKTIDRGIELFDQAYRHAIDRVRVPRTVPYGSPALDAEEELQHAVEAWEGVEGAKANFVGRPTITGDDAFKLYDTYGFPVDLTQLMAEERGMEVDLDRFHELMAQQREQSRAGGGQADRARESLVELVQQSDLPQTEFIGYDQFIAEDARCAELLVLREGRYEPTETLNVDERAAVVVDTTPFYAEAGGQVGDTGYIHSTKGAVFRVDDTISVGGVVFHLGQIEEGNVRRAEPSFSEKDPLLLEIDQPRRRKIMGHHSTTHMLNWALRQVLGDQVTQRGSLVDEAKTRFDFNQTSPLSDEDVQKVQDLVNRYIEADLPVYAAYGPQAKGRQIEGLRAVFGEKYPDTVRIVSMGVPVEDALRKPKKKEWRHYSIEFCGGTHLDRTGEAGRFVLVQEEAVAKGVRRLVGIAGEEAERIISHADVLESRLDALFEEQPESLEQDLASLTETLETVSLPLGQRDTLRGRLQELQKTVKQQQKERQKDAESQVVDQARRLADEAEGPVIVARIDGADGKTLRKAMDVIRSKRPEAAMLLAAPGDEKLAFLAAVPQELIEKGLAAGDWVKAVAEVAGGGGGGKPDMAQAGGKNPAKLKDALETARQFAAEKLGTAV